MDNIFEHIARENFRSSGYITHPSRERRMRWRFSAPPQAPVHCSDTVRDALLRRERARSREKKKPSILKAWLNVFRGQ